MKTYELTLMNGKTIRSLAHAAAEMLDEQERLDVRLLANACGEYTVQTRSRCGQVLQWIGMDQHLTVTLIPAAMDHALLQISGSHWFSRSVLLITGILIVCWPLAVTAAIGAVRSRILIRRILSLMRTNAPP